VVTGILINTVVIGGVYALLALGFSLIFGIGRILFFCHTAFYMMAAYFLYLFSKMLGLGLFLSITLSMILPAVLGLLCYRFLVEPVREHHNAALVITIGLAILMQEVAFSVFGGEFVGVPPLVKGSTRFMGIAVQNQHLLTLGVAVLVLLAVWFFLTKSKPGLAMRAVADDDEVAIIMGIDPAKIGMITTALAMLLAAIAGVIICPVTIIDPEMWMHVLPILLAIVILGGLGSIRGSIVGAFVVAFAEMLVTFLVPGGSYLRDAVALVVLIVVLLVRPEGLFGVAFEEERL
jgi:branched-chain amino acid transport system permease protein